MYRNGMFTNLSWDKENIETHHAKHWEHINSYFGFQAASLKTPTSLPGRNPPKISSLYQLATQCVYTCQPLLFSLTPLEYLHQHAPDVQRSLDFPLSVRHAMESRLHDSLCQHLITTFSYRFFCENLKRHKFQTYCNNFYNSQPKSVFPPIYDAKATERKDHKDGLKDSYLRFYAALSSYLSENNFAHADEYAPIWEDAPTACSSNNLKKYLENELQIDAISPPNGWFLLFFLKIRHNFKHVFTVPASDPYVAFWTLLSGSRHFHSLFPEEIYSPPLGNSNTETVTNKSQSPPPLGKPTLYQKNGCPFIGIPFTSLEKPASTISDRHFPLTKSGKEAKISRKLQVVFNNYLMERNFHLHAMATTEQHLLVTPYHSSFPNSPTDHLHFLFRATQLHAPLVHAPFINFLEQEIDNFESSQLIEQYIYRWNLFALPVLEELFIQSVYRRFPEIDDILEAIDQWLDPATYERLQIIRPVKVEKVVPVVPNPTDFIDEKSLHKRLVSSAFHIPVK